MVGRWFTPPQDSSTPPGSALVQVGITPQGIGRYARTGSLPTINRQIRIPISSALPEASVTTSLNDIPDIDENDCTEVIVSAVSVHDMIGVGLDVVSGPGCFVEWFSKEDIVAPTTAITDIPTMDEGDCAVAIIAPSGGNYDGRTYGLDVVSGPGCFVEYFAKAPIVAPTTSLTDTPNLDEGDCSVVIVTPSGGNYDGRAYGLDVVSGPGCFVEYFEKGEIEAPTTTLSDIPTIDETDCPTVIITPSGGNYDGRAYGLDVVSGPGCFVEYFEKGEIAAPQTVLTNVESIAEDGAIVYEITPSNGLYDGISYGLEVVSGPGCIFLGET